MRRAILTVGLVVLGVAAAVGVAQPPSPTLPLPAGDPNPPRALPPAVSGVQPAAGTAPVPRVGDTPLSKFEPLAAFPITTQHAIRAALLGSTWMTKMSQSQGRFIPGYIPALRQPMQADHDMRQALAALALAQAAKFTGDDRQAAIAAQAVLALLADTRAEPADPTCRAPVRSSMFCNRVGFAAVLALAIYELPVADEKLHAEAEKLCEFLRRQLRADGSVHYVDAPNETAVQVDPAGANEYPGYALHAIAVSSRLRPAAWKADALRKGIDCYRAYFKAHPHPMLAATLSPAALELFLQTQSPDAATALFEMNDWLIEQQYRTNDPRHPTWAGGFKTFANGVETVPGFETGAHLQCLACAYFANRRVTDLNNREPRYRQSAIDAVQYLNGMQYLEANTRHFADGFRVNVLIGGFYLSPADGNLRIDANAWAVSGLLRFLASGAER